MQGKPRQFEITDEDKRIVAGWASVEVKDLQGDIVPVEELKRAMLDYMSKRGGVIMYEHTNLPVGRVLQWEIKTDPETGRPGVWIVAQINRGGTVEDEVWEKIKSGEIKGFSIGGVGKEKRVIMQNENGSQEEVDIIEDLELYEISLTVNPANPAARIEEVNYYAKSASAHGSRGSAVAKDSKCRERYLVRERDGGSHFRRMTCPDDTSRKSRFCGCMRYFMNCEGKDLDSARRLCAYIYHQKYGKSFQGDLEWLIDMAPHVAEIEKSEAAAQAGGSEGALSTADSPGAFHERYGGEAVQPGVVIIGKPFAGFKDFDDCLRHMREQYRDKYSGEKLEDVARRVCGKLYWEHEGRKKRRRKKSDGDKRPPEAFMELPAEECFILCMREGNDEESCYDYCYADEEEETPEQGAGEPTEESMEEEGGSGSTGVRASRGGQSSIKAATDSRQSGATKVPERKVRKQEEEEHEEQTITVEPEEEEERLSGIIEITGEGEEAGAEEETPEEGRTEESEATGGEAEATAPATVPDLSQLEERLARLESAISRLITLLEAGAREVVSAEDVASEKSLGRPRIKIIRSSAKRLAKRPRVVSLSELSEDRTPVRIVVRRSRDVGKLSGKDYSKDIERLEKRLTSLARIVAKIAKAVATLDAEVKKFKGSSGASRKKGGVAKAETPRPVEAGNTGLAGNPELEALIRKAAEGDPEAVVKLKEFYSKMKK